MEQLKTSIDERRKVVNEGEFDDELYQLLQIYIEIQEVWSRIDDFIEFDLKVELDTNFTL